jgi:iron complex outermembrane receptor protein
MAFFSPFSRRSSDRFSLRTTFRATHIASAVALLGLSCAHAQSPTEITITDTAPSQISGFGDVPASKAPFSAISFDRQVLQDIGAQRVSDALRLDASVADSYNSPAYWDMLSVRGYTLDNRYNYRREGLPISAETMIPMDNKERIELFKGTSGIQAGTSAPGGLVNYVVKRAPSGNDEVIRSVSASYGPGKSSSIGLDLGGRFGENKDLGYRFNAAYEDLNPYIRNTEGHRNLIALAMDWRISADSKLEWEFEKSERQQMGVNGYSLLGTQLPATVDGKSNLTRQSWSVPGVFAGTTGSVRFKQNLGDGWLWTTSYGAQRLRTDDRLTFGYGCDLNQSYTEFCPTSPESKNRLAISDFRSENERRVVDAIQTELMKQLSIGQTIHNIQINASRHRSLIRPSELSTWNEAGWTTFEGGGVNQAAPTPNSPNTNLSEYNTAIAINDHIEVNAKSSIWLGLRHTQLSRGSISTDGSEATSDNRSFTTPWLATSFKLSAAETVYASYGEGVETEVAPNRATYTNAGQALPALRSKQYELGIKSQTATTRWQATVFDITRPQSADACDTSGLVCTRQIDGQAHHRGLELSGGMTQAQWSGDVSAAWIDAQRQNAEIDPSVNGQTALNVPRMTLRGLVQYRFAEVPGLRTSLRVSHEAERRVLEDGSLNLPAWTTLDWAAHYDTRIDGTRTQWTLAIDNLTDRHYWRESPKQFGHYYLYPGAPRTLRLAVKASF